MSSSADVRRLPPRPRAGTRGFHFPLIALFSITGLLGIFFGLVRGFGGVTGAFLFAYLTVLMVGATNLFRLRIALGIWVPRVTVLEFFVLLFWCLMLHGFSMPAVQMKGRPRGAGMGPMPGNSTAIAKPTSPGASGGDLEFGDSKK